MKKFMIGNSRDSPDRATGPPGYTYNKFRGKKEWVLHGKF